MDRTNRIQLDRRKRVILALDTDSFTQACQWVERFRGRLELFKVGSQLFTREGPRSVSGVRERGGEVFLDLKYHDIPNTVGHAVAAATAMGVAFVNVHALGGREMIKRAVDAGREEAELRLVTPPRVLAVTILTSLDDNDLGSLGLHGDVNTCVMRLANMAIEAGADGLIASPREVKALRRDLGDDVLLVTPGIRAIEAGGDDQKRVMGPMEALQAGADYIVMGRSLLNAPEPMELVESLTDL